MTGDEIPSVTVLGRRRRSWRASAVGLTHMLVVPQGFTLAVGGSLAICVGHHGYPGPVGVWLFVAGASLGYCALILVLGAARPKVSTPVGIVGLALFNVAAVVVVPVATLAGWWISNADLAYFVSGLVVHLLYIPVVAAGTVLLTPSS